MIPISMMPPECPLILTYQAISQTAWLWSCLNLISLLILSLHVAGALVASSFQSQHLVTQVDSPHFFAFLERAELLRTPTFKFRRLSQKLREEMVKTWTRAIILAMPWRVRLERTDCGDKIWGKHQKPGYTGVDTCSSAHRLKPMEYLTTGLLRLKIGNDTELMFPPVLFGNKINISCL